MENSKVNSIRATWRFKQGVQILVGKPEVFLSAFDSWFYGFRGAQVNGIQSQSDPHKRGLGGSQVSKDTQKLSFKERWQVDGREVTRTGNQHMRQLNSLSPME